MEFVLLGPIEVFDGDRTVPLGGARNREVLAMLLLNANRVVSTDQLIDSLWTEDPPKTARNSVQRFVSDLRKALGDTDGSLLHTRDGGYLLDVADGELDIDVFESLAFQGRAAFGDGRAADASSMFQMALALWTGVPFGDLRYAEFARVHVSRLEESRIAVIEDRIDAELALAHHSKVIGELESLTAEYPFRERLWGQLMLALYRAGRQAEALRTYQKARVLFAEDLGIDPSRDLQQLEEQILLQDPSLIVEVHAKVLSPNEQATTSATGRAVRGYEMREEIGHGTFGVVYRAYQASVGREVAIKIIRPWYANNPEFIRRFENEAQVVAKLEHPHIVPLYDFWREGDGAYLAMRWMRAGSLEGTLRRGPWSIEAAGRLINQVGAALRVAHRHGISHGDVKPANILLDDDGNAYLSDFGIAADLAFGATDGTPTSSPSYYSPEQLRNEPATPQTDIFGLGLVLFELLTGHHPFPDLAGNDLAGAFLSMPLPPLPAHLSSIEGVISEATAGDPANRYTTIDEFLAAFTSVLVPESRSEEIVIDTSIENPYKGLRAFQQTDAADYFGRTALVERLVDRLGDSRFLTLVGPSGSGKSSAVRAGLIPALQEGALPNSERWFVVEMVPGDHPLEELEAGLLRIAVNPPPTLLEQLGSDEHGLLRAVKRVLPDEASELVLVIDQFEELFTLVSEESSRLHFLESLRAAVGDPHSRIRVIITLRADFYDRPLAYRNFGELVQAGSETILPLSLEELVEAIAAPAERRGVTFESGLVAEMANDVSDQPGALPLLQYALTELFEQREGGTMTKDSYRAMGGAIGALGQRAEELYAALDGPGRVATRQLFLRLVTVSHSAEDDTRRRVLRSELLSLEGDTRPIGAAIEVYGLHRLLSFDRDPVTRGPTVEVAHEALLREWGRLRDWIEESREDLAVHRRLTTATSEWISADRDAGYLLSGNRLAQMEIWTATSGLALANDERVFIDASLTRRDTEQATEQSRSERETATERRAVRRLLALVVVLLLAVAATTVLSLVALDRTRKANAEALAATVQSLTTAAISDLDSDPEASVLLALEAVDRLEADGQEVPGDVLDVITEALGGLRVVRRIEAGTFSDLSGDAMLIATSGENGELLLWETASGDLVAQLSGQDNEPVVSLKFSPDGERLAAVRSDGSLEVWDVANRRLEAETTTVQEPFRLSWSGNGEFLVVGGDTVSEVWDTATGDVVWRSIQGVPQNPTALDDDGGRVAAVRRVEVGPTFLQSTVAIWSTDESTLLARLDHPKDEIVCALSFGPTGQTIATGSVSGVIRLWSLVSLTSSRDVSLVFTEPVSIFTGPVSPACSLAWSGDGTQLLTGGVDGVGRLWDVDTGREALRLSGQGGAVTAVAIARSGLVAVTTTADGVTRLWNTAPILDTESTITESSSVYKVVYGPAGDTIAISTAERIALWDVATRQEVVSVDDGGVAERFPTMGVSITDDGHILASPSIDLSSIGVYDTTTGALIRTVSSPAEGPHEMTFLSGTHLLAVANQSTRPVLWDVEADTRSPFLLAREASVNNRSTDATPDGRWIVTSSLDGTAIIWESSTMEPVATLEHGDLRSADVAISPDGKTVAVGLSSGEVQLWDAATESLRQTLEGHIGTVNSVRFSRDGAQLASGGVDGTTRLWDTSSWAQTRLFNPRDGQINDVDFSPDGSTLVTAGQDGKIRFWTLDTKTLIVTARASVTRTLTEAECANYIPDGKCD